MSGLCSTSIILMSVCEQMKLHPLSKENQAAILQLIKINISVFIPKLHALISISGIQKVSYIYFLLCSKTQEEITFSETAIFVISWLKCKWTCWKCFSIVWALVQWHLFRETIFVDQQKKSAEPLDWKGRKPFNLKVEHYQCNNVHMATELSRKAGSTGSMSSLNVKIFWWGRRWKAFFN